MSESVSIQTIPSQEAPSPKSEYILEMRGVSKSFPGVKALDQVDLCVKRGSVHAVMGENGAGKSTLMKVLLGIYKQDEGTITFKGEERHFRGPQDALNAGLAMIHQELSTVQQLTVAENLFLGKEKTQYGFLSKRKMVEEAQALFDDLHMDIDPKSLMGSLSVSRQQMCEIAKAVSYNADLIIMDEPTSAITESEVKHLFNIINDLLNRGITIIYITHKMDEVFQITDEISVYRDGRFINTLSTADTTRNKLIELMVGRELGNIFPKEYAEIGDVILRVEGLTRDDEFNNVSFDLHAGEILGMAGLVGAGRSEVAETIFGVRKKKSGKIFLHNKEVKIDNPRDAINNGMALLTEDRKSSGCFLPLSVRINTYIASVNDHSQGPFVNHKATIKSAAEMKDAMAIKTPSLEQRIGNLSGGNQQKVLVGRWLLTNPEILIVDEPTRGIDVGAKREIHKLISQLAKQGKGIIMISSELEEVLGMCDRILVMSEGRLTGILNREEATQEKILRFATGETE